jgi:hypothetical protein
MVAIDQRKFSFRLKLETIDLTVLERVEHFSQPECRQNGIMGDPPQSKNTAELR